LTLLNRKAGDGPGQQVCGQRRRLELSPQIDRSRRALSSRSHFGSRFCLLGSRFLSLSRLSPRLGAPRRSAVAATVAAPVAAPVGTAGSSLPLGLDVGGLGVGGALWLLLDRSCMHCRRGRGVGGIYLGCDSLV